MEALISKSRVNCFRLICELTRCYTSSLVGAEHVKRRDLSVCKFPQGLIVDGAQNHAFLAAAHALHICCLGPGIYWADFYLDIKRPWH